MAMTSTPASYVSDGHVVLTGPITGSVTTSDGTTYDCSAPVIEVAEHHAQEVAGLISQYYADNGHPQHDAENPFVYDQAQPEVEAQT